MEFQKVFQNLKERSRFCRRENVELKKLKRLLNIDFYDNNFPQCKIPISGMLRNVTVSL